MSGHPTERIRVLCVDDNPALLDLMSRYLTRESDSFVVDGVESGAAALEALSATEYDAVVSDYQMPEMDGLQLLETLRSRGDDVPFIVFTGQGREAVAIEALNLGADQYVQKGGDPRAQYGVLARAIRRAVDHDRARRGLQRREQDLSVTLDSIVEGVITTDAEGTVTRLNPAAERLTGWNAGEAVGEPLTRVFRIADERTGDPVLDPVQKVLERGESVELANHTVLTAKDGAKYHISDSAAPIRDGDETIGVVLVFRDLSDRYRRHRRMERQQSTLLSLTRDDTAAADFEATCRRIVSASAETLGTDRASVWLLDEDETRLSCVTLYDRKETAYREPEPLSAETFPAYFEAVATELAIAAADVRSDPRTSELGEAYLEPLGITSMLDSAVRVRGRIRGVLCHEHTGPPREWHADEIAFAAAVADQVGRGLLLCDYERD